MVILENIQKKLGDLIEKTRPDLFICGHSHILKVIYDKQYKLLHMNPGQLEIMVFIKLKPYKICY